jgi:3-keto-L-gulonate-6-phosphate decarboxylase
MFEIFDYGLAVAAGFALGKYGMPLIEKLYQAYKHSRVLANAKKVVAQAEADAQALAAAKAVVASAPVAPAPAAPAK